MIHKQFENFIQDKSVVFVCPSPILIGSKLGRWIDGHDIVIRTNNSINMQKKYEKDYGSRTDILYVNNQYVKELSPFPIREWYAKGLRWLCFKCGVVHQNIYGKYVQVRTMSHVYNQVKDKVASALMGTLIVQDIINYKPQKFNVVGMTFYNGKVIDWENQYIPGYLPDVILKPALEKRAKGFFNKDKIHDTESNKTFIFSLYKKKLFNFDDITKKALNINKIDFSTIPNFEEKKIMEKTNIKNPIENLMPRRISIRNAKNAKIGLQDLCNHIKQKIRQNQEIKILEVGSFAGDSTEIFAINFSEIYCVDPWKSNYDTNDNASNPNIYNMIEVEKQFDAVKEKYGNIKKFKMSSMQAANLFENEFFDIVYIDGNHQEYAVRQDIRTWLPKVKKKGWLCGHDYQPGKFPGTVKAVNEILSSSGDVLKFLDSSWLWRKV